MENTERAKKAPWKENPKKFFAAARRERLRRIIMRLVESARSYGKVSLQGYVRAFLKGYPLSEKFAIAVNASPSSMEHRPVLLWMGRLEDIVKVTLKSENASLVAGFVITREKDIPDSVTRLAKLPGTYIVILSSLQEACKLKELIELQQKKGKGKLIVVAQGTLFSRRDAQAEKDMLIDLVNTTRRSHRVFLVVTDGQMLERNSYKAKHVLQVIKRTLRTVTSVKDE